MDAGKDKNMIDIHERAINRIGDILIELQDSTLYRMSDALEAAERTAAELRAQLATVTAKRDAAISAAQCASNFLSFDHAGTGEQLKAYLYVKDRLLKVLP